jgi:hypothetical protein
MHSIVLLCCACTNLIRERITQHNFSTKLCARSPHSHTVLSACNVDRLRNGTAELRYYSSSSAAALHVLYDSHCLQALLALC